MKVKKVSQRSVARMLKAGKPLAGLLVGLSSTLGAAERELSGLAIMGKPLPIVTTTNKVSEVRERPIMGKPASPVRATEMPPAVPEGFYRVAYGDSEEPIDGGSEGPISVTSGMLPAEPEEPETSVR